MAKRQAAAELAVLLILDDDNDDECECGKTRDWIKRREVKCAFTNIIKELRMEDSNGFKEMMRMDYETFLPLKLYRT